MSFRFSFPNYLSSKVSVDDRSLHHRVFQTFLDALKSQPNPRVLEIGAGIGTMAQRLHARLPGPLSYELLDNQAENLEVARTRLGQLPGWDLKYTAQDLWPYLADIDTFGSEQRFDAVLAHAVLDLFSLEKLLPELARLGKPGAVAWFTINFDAMTAWEPEIDPVFDRLVIETYHRTMDERVTDGKISGDSRSGRHLFTLLPKLGWEILDAGSSDWAVWPTQGRYPAEEQTFLFSLLHFFEESLGARPEIDPSQFKNWLQVRRRQIENGQAVFLAHQWDFVARFPYS